MADPWGFNATYKQIEVLVKNYQIRYNQNPLYKFHSAHAAVMKALLSHYGFDYIVASSWSSLYGLSPNTSKPLPFGTGTKKDIAARLISVWSCERVPSSQCVEPIHWLIELGTQSLLDLNPRQIHHQACSEVCLHSTLSIPAAIPTLLTHSGTALGV